MDLLELFCQVKGEERSSPPPPRFEDNWINNRDNCYARYYSYPTSQDELRKWIEDAHKARTARANLIVDSRSMMKRNIQCRICGVTH